MSRPTAVFRMQLLVSGAGMLLGVGMLFMGRDPAVYLPLVTSIIGYWLPAPQHPGDERPAPSSAQSVNKVDPQVTPGLAASAATVVDSTNLIKKNIGDAS